MSAEQELRAACFEFVSDLAKDLSRDDLDLPGFPATVVELHRTLGDANSSVQDVVSLINTEPALAARLIKLANSAAFSRNDREVCEPRAAITQLGFNVVRSTATTFAMKQMEQQEWLQPVLPQLERIWKQSNGVAAICAGISKRVDGVRSDEALATGLFHQIGNLYLLTRAHQKGLVAGNSAWDDIADEWHPTIARAIIESWGISEAVGIAAELQDTLADDEPKLEDLSNLSRMLSAAKLYNSLNAPTRQNLDTNKIEGVLTGTTVGGKPFMELAAESREDIDAVRQSIAA